MKCALGLLQHAKGLLPVMFPFRAAGALQGLVGGDAADSLSFESFPAAFGASSLCCGR
jgi:hypothetical protein